MSPEIQQCVDILRQFGAKEVYLFGSRARGDSAPDSDYDFAVRGVPSDRMNRLVGELLVTTRLEIDVIALDDGSPFAKHIEGKIQEGSVQHVG